ncbi:MAG: hypothetical protein A2339_04455 [Elusimicrobia bacterium RIFOXYB12_FULL_50_12]|nr:MAG: hypothetical protein A2278_07280 [Elusimicrobia bacterium RIFOXYA12_FULL_49_49]OGS16165.1 MAG: hypothetical protein A2251_00905 [Elusimicrobia bacterium RIFOXYA2_FULL_47_53]OGS26636.1 MAG: hypothetical protein A2339_04455 [Elusimicrobia bacterium RIFOXYB12_FULL_50_12]OGS31319.1 MAG: hypothetical protein A2323_09195 [Elusimicrobia bacterium RIFOXYB2_FULL_46_23]
MNESGTQDLAQQYVVSTRSAINSIKNLESDWKISVAGQRVANYYLQVRQMLQLVNYDVSKMNRNVFKEIRLKMGWSERHKWPMTAWNSFCKYGMVKAPELFTGKSLIEKAKRRKMMNIPGIIVNEIQCIIDSHIVRVTSDKLSVESQKHIFASFKVFMNYVLGRNPERTIDTLSDFCEQDALDFKDHLLKECKSPLTGAIVSINTISAFLIDLRRIFKYGCAQKKLKVNIFKDISIEKHKTAKRMFCLSKEQVDKLRTVNEASLEKMTLREQFEQIRNNAMISLQYEGALRGSEVVRLTWEDIPVSERARSNVGPIIVRGAKARPANHEDRVYILFDRVDRDLLRWKKIADLFLHSKNMEPPKYTSNGKEYHPIFFSTKGTMLDSGTYISSIFAAQLVKSDTVLPRGFKTHILRHSKLTHFVDDGLPFEKLHENARHSSLDETWNYFHGSTKKRIEAIEKVEKIDALSSKIKTSLLPDKGILKEIVGAVVEVAGVKSENFNALYAEIEKVLLNRCEDYSIDGEYYTFRQVMDKFGIGRSQTWERIGMLVKQGILNPVQLKSKRLYPIKEIEHIAEMVDTRKASISFGYNEKVPTTIPDLANKGIIKSTKVGKLHFFEPSELVDHFFHKNSK